MCLLQSTSEKLLGEANVRKGMRVKGKVRECGILSGRQGGGGIMEGRKSGTMTCVVGEVTKNDLSTKTSFSEFGQESTFFFSLFLCSWKREGRL